MNKFDENYNLRTLNLPSEKVNSNNEINDDLFDNIVVKKLNTSHL